MVVTREFAEHFAADWIAAWNAHDIERVLSHYHDDFEMTSPYIVQIAGEPCGVLKGKRAVGDYWRTALSRMPSLRFEHVATLVGVGSVTIYYKGVRGMAAEVFFFASDGLVTRACAHYE